MRHLWLREIFFALVVLMSSELACAQALASPVPQIVGLEAANEPSSGARANTTPTVGLNGELLVKLSTSNSNASQPVPNVDRYVLFLNGRPLTGIPAPVYHARCQCVGFQLKRFRENSDMWTSLLGSPTHLAIPVSVSLGTRAPGQTAVEPTIFGVTEDASTFNLEIISPWRLTVAIVVIVAMVIIVWGHSRKNTTLRDGYLPQIAPRKQTYSLARWQMAFWFTLIFTSFLFLFLLLWDFNTISAQALILLGISGVTAAGAIAVDVARDSPADAINRGLQALGLYTYADVLRVRDEITTRNIALNAEMAANPPDQQKISGLQIEIQDRMNILQTYEDKTGPFETQGWFKDITTDINGTSLHRLQAFLWTWVLGAVFLVGVYRDLAMPEFSAALLALMGISSAGYVGFKIQEQNN